MEFEKLNLSEKTIEAIRKLNYEKATEVQQKVIPEIIVGNDLVVRSQTGTGKTAAFGIGVIERLNSNRTSKVLVLTPTRELAIQVCREIANLAQFQQLKVRVVYGGHSIAVQSESLRNGVDILVATPGRLLDLYRRGEVYFNKFNILVLDEADQMLDLGFKDELDLILSMLPRPHQTILVSATIDDNVLRMIRDCNNPKHIEVGSQHVASTITEEIVETTPAKKYSHLVEVLRNHMGLRTLIFVETKFGVEKVKDRLYRDGFKVGMLQGDMSQASRNSVLEGFKDGQFSILVATNVASRGLHIDDLGLIINYDQAQTEELHLHRVGRTGRMGQEGKAISFVMKVESREERMDDEHRDFAWMKQGASPFSRGPPRSDNYSREGGNYQGSRNPHSRSERAESSRGGYSRSSDSRSNTNDFRRRPRRPTDYK